MLTENLNMHDEFKSDEDIIAAIQERYRRRVSWHKAEKTLILQGKAICRRLCGGDKDLANALFDRVAKLKTHEIIGVLHRNIEVSNIYDQQLFEAVENLHPIVMAKNEIEGHREKLEHEYSEYAKRLPIAQWVMTIDGVSWGSVAAIIGSTGDLRLYPTPSRVWKRMGLAVMEDGRQRPMRDKERAAAHGYNRVRRSVMWNVGTSILRAQTEKFEDLIDPETGEAARDAKGKKIKTDVVKRPAGPWRKVYDARRAYEEPKNEAGDYAQQAENRLREASFDHKTAAYKAYSQGKLPPLHLHQRAQRYMEKQFLKEFWVQWHQCMPPLMVFEEEGEESEVAA